VQKFAFETPRGRQSRGFMAVFDKAGIIASCRITRR
jgi:hypothetical protein